MGQISIRPVYLVDTHDYEDGVLNLVVKQPNGLNGWLNVNAAIIRAANRFAGADFWQVAPRGRRLCSFKGRPC
jgi:hypothetical protein